VGDHATRAEEPRSTREPSGDALFLVWGPPSHGPRSRVLARELGLPIRFVHVTERRGLLVAPYKYLRQAIETVRCLSRERPRTVVVQSPPSLAVPLVALWCRLTGGTYVVDAHSDAMDSSYWARPRWLHRALARRAAATIVTNQHFADRLGGWGARAIVIRDVPTTFEVGVPWTRDGGFWVTVVNSFGPDEPLDEILAAAEALPDVRFHVTGALRRARAEVVDAAPRNVTFTDFLPDDRYYALLASSDAVMCLTTRDHTMQRGACEALSLGVPIITSRWPLLEEYFHAGTVHVSNDAAGIRAGIQRMRAHHDEHRRGIAELQRDQVAEWEVGSSKLHAALAGGGPPIRAGGHGS
jgi:glycosyltransferase involved in cell wall biosynthesis